MLIFIIKAIFWVSAGLIGYSYIAYPIILFIINKLQKSVEFIFSNHLPMVSIVIAAYNEEDVIEKRIENCLDLDYTSKSLEIIIASDGSDDRTNDIISRYGHKGIKPVIFKERQGKVNVLNEVVPQAKNEIIVFSDANTLFQRDAINMIVRNFEDENVGCVCGRL